MNMSTNPDPQQPLGGVLHVVFHGAFCFFDPGDDNIYVRVPFVRDMDRMMGKGHGDVTVAEHTYIAGNWLNERTFIPGKKFELRGVEKGHAKFDPTKNLHLKGAINAKSPGPVYAEMTFPRPDRIDSLQRGKIKPKEVFEGNDFDMVKDVQEVSTVQVFGYKFKDHQKLELHPHPRSAFQGEGHLIKGFCSLHLFAEPDNTPPAEHLHHAFQAGLSMYSKAAGKEIGLGLLKPPILEPPKIEPTPQKEVPEGTILAEFEDLPTRLKRLSALGVRLLRNDDLKGFFKKESAETDSSDPVNCAGMFAP
jgi:hypothetical protein